MKVIIVVTEAFFFRSILMTNLGRGPGKCMVIKNLNKIGWKELVLLMVLLLLVEESGTMKMIGKRNNSDMRKPFLHGSGCGNLYSTQDISHLFSLCISTTLFPSLLYACCFSQCRWVYIVANFLLKKYLHLRFFFFLFNDLWRFTAFSYALPHKWTHSVSNLDKSLHTLLGHQKSMNCWYHHCNLCTLHPLHAMVTRSAYGAQCVV